MYNYIQKKLKSSHFYLSRFGLASLGFALLSVQTHATGLQKAKGILELIKTEILGIVPVIAVIALIGLGVGYAMNSIQKETFMRWAVGLIIVGSASQITNMLVN